MLLNMLDYYFNDFLLFYKYIFTLKNYEKNTNRNYSKIQ